MNIVIPIGGIGQRFREEGYTMPKPLIGVLGKPMIYRVISGLNLEPEDKIHIIYHPDLNSFNFEDLLKFKFPDINFNLIQLEGNTRGAAETLLFGLDRLLPEDMEDNFIILDCDTFYEDDIISKYKNSRNKNLIFYFEDIDDSPIFSYINRDDSGKVLEIKEKIKISNYANTGAYGFSSGFVLKKYAEKILSLDRELYISLIYNEMIKSGEPIYSDLVEKFNCVGTPLQLKIYCENNLSEERLRFCFDLDNTLVSYPEIKGDYSTVKPIQRNIDYLKLLKERGHSIIIYTARRMKTHKGNVGAVTADISKVTFETLDKFGIPYDEIYFGKPYADFYIDDLAINPSFGLDKSLGFIDTKISPRIFNKISYVDRRVLKETNNPGEIFWYKNMPGAIKKYFPEIFRLENKTIEMEKVHGVNYSYLYVNMLLKEDDLKNLLLALKEIHSLDGDGDPAIIYQNYSEKIKKRYYSNLSIYNNFESSGIIFDSLISNLGKYEKSKDGCIGIIHGDPVFTNSFLTERGIKFIDPRGKVGDLFSIYGDIYYDYSKVYQSILGYDNILNGYESNFEYQDKMIKCFEENFSEAEMKNIRNITAGLFFSLIPLHEFSEIKFSKYLKICKKLLKI